MRVAGFLKTSLLDWDGMVSAVLFLPGCNFRCPFCQNADLVMGESGKVDMEAVETYLVEHSDFLDGVVITGGEPTLQPDLLQLIKWLRGLGMKIKLDTNGTRPEVLDDLLGAGLVDYVAMDVKAPLDNRYTSLCGVEPDLGAIHRSIDIIMSSGVDYEFRTTVVPILLKEGDVEDIARAITGARKYVLQQFVPGTTLDPKLSLLDPYTGQRMLDMAKLARKHVRKVLLRGDV